MGEVDCSVLTNSCGIRTAGRTSFLLNDKQSLERLAFDHSRNACELHCSDAVSNHCQASNTCSVSAIHPYSSSSHTSIAAGPALMVSGKCPLLTRASMKVRIYKPRNATVIGTRQQSAKEHHMKKSLFIAFSMALSLSAVAQMPTFRVHVTSRSTPAINYKHRSGASKVDFAGTALMPSANGQAKVESKKGYIEIEVEFGNFEKSMTFGTEYLTYVLWAITPEGRSVNLGEMLVGSNHRGKLDVTTDLQAFALIVTAEPYYAVRQPSNVVVLENVVRNDTKGTTEEVNAKYELMERGSYIPTGYKFDPVVLNARLPLEFFEARNALRIAESEGAERYASDSYRHAVKLMDEVDADATQKHMARKQLIAVSREEVQVAEDAREIAVKKMDEERLSDERQASADSLSRSRAQTDDATRQKE